MKPRRGLACVLSALAAGVWLLAPPRAAASDLSSGAAVPPKVRVGVAAFERVAPEGVHVPDIAALLADRLTAGHSVAAVGPSGLPGGAIASPSAEQIQAWARGAGAEAIVTGRATRLGARTSVDARVWSGESGRPLATYVEEAPRPDALVEALDRLAGRVAEGLTAGAGPEPPAVAAAPAARPPAPKAAAKKESEEKGFRPLRGGEPLSIESDEIEALEQGGRRTLVFSRNVRVVQGEMRLRADRLDAFYPAGGSQPERLVATGRVRVAQQARELLCDKATFTQADQRLLCVGSAELREGEDRVRGKQIEIFFDSNRIRVTGGATLNATRSGGGS